MTDHDATLADIVARACPLAGRVSQGRPASHPTSAGASASARLARWSASLNRHDSRAFSRRLAWAGWQVDDVLVALESSPMSTTPSWAQTLRDVVACAQGLSATGRLDEHPDWATFPLDPDDPVPFEAVLLPVALTARARLRHRLGHDDGALARPAAVFSAPAQRAVERALLVRLGEIGGPALDAAFGAARPLGHVLLRRLLGHPTASGDREYQAFVAGMLASGLLDLFRPYPVLARLWATTVEAWVEATAELFLRLLEDLPQIQRHFGHPNPGQVVDLRVGLSDPHRGGRSVALVTFQSGFRVVYKPRSLDLDLGFGRVVGWCNRHTGDGLPLKVLDVLARQGYGWVEYVEQAPCIDAGAGQRFFRRAGKLLCLVHVLRGTDGHWENLIACGDQPVLVDLETMLQHDPPAAEEFAAASGPWAPDEFHDSVVRTGLLPRWQVDERSGLAHDVSGLGAVTPQMSPRPVLRWVDVNRDDMHLKAVASPLPQPSNAAVREGRVLSPNDYVDDIVAGFEAMYRLLGGRREELLDAHGPLAALRSLPSRFLPRHTDLYSAVQQRGLTPGALGDGADHSIELEVLAVGLLSGEDRPRAWSMLASEVAAMEALDIPYVETRPESRSVRLDTGETLDGFFDDTSWSQVVAQLRQLGPRDMAHQARIIRGAFSARLSSATAAERMVALDAPERAGLDGAVAPRLTREALIERALALAAEIEARAHAAPAGGLRWIGLGQARHSDRYELQPLGPGLFDGYCGVALFLGAMDSVAPTPGRRQVILDSLRPLCDALHATPTTPAAAFARRIGIGGAIGLGSVVYCLARLSVFLHAPELLQGAAQAADWIGEPLIARDREFDVVGGSAGALLGLLSLYQVSEAPRHLAAAARCGEHLLRHRTAAPDGSRVWTSHGARPLTGFSHGAAGIAYALLRLHAVTGDATWRDAAQEALAYERSTFSPAHGNWPDLRNSDDATGPARFMASWCHGAPGIALARLGGLAAVDGPEAREELAIALRTTLGVGLTGVDHVCCGNFGRIEVLQVAARVLQRPDLADQAQRWTEAVVAQAGSGNAFRLLPEVPGEVCCPGFFHGTAGIGYQLLRQAMPALPSVLLWE